MKCFACLMIASFMMLATAGCGKSTSTSLPIDQTELEKYVEENPVPLVTASDFEATNSADE